MADEVPNDRAWRGFLSSPSNTVGEWLSLVEHLVRDQGVGGSNPLSPTNYPKQFQLDYRRSRILDFHNLGPLGSI